MDANETRFYQILEDLNITDYIVHEHEALFSAEQEGAEDCMFPGLNLKNLLVKDKKTERFYQIILEDHRRMDNKHFRKLAGWSNRSSFASPEDLWDILKLRPGSVTPYALFNDVNHRITLVLGAEISEADDMEWINLHPCRNTATISLHKKDFFRVIQHFGNEIIEESVAMEEAE